MELKEFIKKAISDIEESMDEIKTENGVVYYLSRSKKDFMTINEGGSIDFDLLVSSSGTDKSGAGIKAGIQVFSAGIGGESEKTTSDTSRIKFSLTRIRGKE
jgi:hypothetical protein